MSIALSRRKWWAIRSVAALGGWPIPSDASGITGNTAVWFALSLAFAALCAAGGLRYAFQAPDVVQDDARTFLFWMERFSDPELFPHDLMADYFSAVSPPAYTALHWVAAVIFGIDPFLLNKLLPTILGLITTVYAFLLSMRLLRVPAAAFVACTILTESLWLADAIPSGTPRAFIYPIFLAFVYYFLDRRYALSLCAIGLLGLFYPQMLTIALGTVLLSLVHWKDRKLRLSTDRRRYLLLAGAGVAAVAIVVWASLLSARFGPVVTADQARSMIEFTYSGRTYFFTPDFWKFWVWGERTGFAPYGMRPPLIWIGLLLPVLARFPAAFPLIRQVSPMAGILTRVVVASSGMFFAAHLLLFRLHLPSRYTQHSLRIVLSLAAGIVLLVVLDGLWGWLQAPSAGRRRVRTVVAVAAGAGMLGLVVLYPVVLWLSGVQFPKTQYLVGREIGLYDYLESQPKDIVIAAFSQQTDLIPSFAKRSILTGYEYGIPYHLGYYDQIRQRTHDLVRAQYSFDPGEVRQFIERYNISFWLLDQAAYTHEYVTRSPWIHQTQPEGAAAAASLDKPGLPVVVRLAQRCQAYLGQRVILLDAACVKSLASE